LTFCEPVTGCASDSFRQGGGRRRQPASWAFECGIILHLLQVLLPLGVPSANSCRMGLTALDGGGTVGECVRRARCPSLVVDLLYRGPCAWLSKPAEFCCFVAARAKGNPAKIPEPGSGTDSPLGCEPLVRGSSRVYLPGSSRQRDKTRGSGRGLPEELSFLQKRPRPWKPLRGR